MLMDPEAASVLEQNALLRAALAASQADVTRLAAKLAESARALAVSQGEATALRERVRAARLQASHLACDLERARGLLQRLDDIYQRGLSTDGQMYELGVLFRDNLTFLAPPTAAASPEPDRACPEVIAKEPR